MGGVGGDAAELEREGAAGEGRERDFAHPLMFHGSDAFAGI